MEAGDLVKLKFQGNGQPGIGVIYSVGTDPGRQFESVFKCLWDVPAWNRSLWHEHELEVISEDH